MIGIVSNRRARRQSLFLVILILNDINIFVIHLDSSSSLCKGKPPMTKIQDLKKCLLDFPEKKSLPAPYHFRFGACWQAGGERDIPWPPPTSLLALMGWRMTSVIFIVRGSRTRHAKFICCFWRRLVERQRKDFGNLDVTVSAGSALFTR